MQTLSYTYLDKVDFAISCLSDTKVETRFVGNGISLRHDIPKVMLGFAFAYLICSDIMVNHICAPNLATLYTSCQIFYPSSPFLFLIQSRHHRK
jgi:hypothetical protein